eukprot:3563668-Rhodomonas_salina.7
MGSTTGAKASTEKGTKEYASADKGGMLVQTKGVCKYEKGTSWYQAAVHDRIALSPLLWYQHTLWSVPALAGSYAIAPYTLASVHIMLRPISIAPNQCQPR